ncbi:MAG TPA: DUF2752 domain-containing protein [Tepidisphaeraceae bacterium]
MTAPPIYVGMDRPDRLGVGPRLIALAVALGALGVLLTAAWLSPDARGVGTHEGLGLQPCGFLLRTGLPCAGCGMTTSFADAVRGRLVSSFVAQPFGLILCVLTAAAFWSALYVSVTARPAYRLLHFVPGKVHVVVWPTLTLAAWAWKVAAMKLGVASG